MTEIWPRRILYLAGAWNVLGGASALLDPTRHFAQLYNTSLSLGDPLQAFFFQCTWISVVAWGVAYILAARQPTARGPILLAGGAGKLTYFGACSLRYFSGSGNTMLLAAGVMDLAFARFFAYVLWHERSNGMRALDV